MSPSLRIKAVYQPGKCICALMCHRKKGYLWCNCCCSCHPIMFLRNHYYYFGHDGYHHPLVTIIAFMVASPLTSPKELIYSAGIFGWPFALSFLFLPLSWVYWVVLSERSSKSAGGSPTNPDMLPQPKPAIKATNRKVMHQIVISILSLSVYL